MSDLTDLAAKIDAMTLDEMVFAATADDRPMAGNAIVAQVAAEFIMATQEAMAAG